MSEISFSQTVKEEILTKINSKPKADACLYGLLLCTNELSADKISFVTSNTAAADFFELNVTRICGENSVIKTITSRRGTDMSELSLSTPENRKTLLGYFKIGENRTPLDPKYPKRSLHTFFVAGMFLSCGSISDPQKAYHMEFALPNLALCNALGFILLDEFELLAKNVRRKNHEVLYFKESDNIIDMIAMMGATSASFELTNVKIFKDMRNKINRGMNCTNANIDKQIAAGERQIKDIELIDSTKGLDALPDNLREIAIVRYENPDISLSELGEMLHPPISRSGANHRLQKIAQIAEEIRRLEQD